MLRASFTELAGGYNLSSEEKLSQVLSFLLMTQQAKKTENPTVPFLAKLVIES